MARSWSASSGVTRSTLLPAVTAPPPPAPPPPGAGVPAHLHLGDVHVGLAQQLSDRPDQARTIPVPEEEKQPRRVEVNAKPIQPDDSRLPAGGGPLQL